MKRLLVNSVILAALTSSSIVACTKGNRERPLKAEAVPAAAQKPVADAAGLADQNGIAPVTSSILKPNPGFAKIDGTSPAAIQSAAASLVRIVVSQPSSKPESVLTADLFAKKFNLEGTKVSEVLSAMAALAEKQVKEKSTKSAVGELDRKLNLLAAVQLEACKDMELKDCTIFLESKQQTGFSIPGSKILTTVDFLDSYVQTVLKNSSEFSKLASPQEKIDFIKKSPLKIIIENKAGIISSQVNLVAKLDDVSLNAMKLIGTGVDLKQLSPADAVVSLKLEQVPTGLSMSPISKSSISCATLTSGSVDSSIVGRVLEDVKRAKPADKLGAGEKDSTMMTTGKTAVNSDALMGELQKQLSFLKDANASDLKSMESTIIVSAADSAAGFTGAPILNEKGEYVGVLTHRTSTATAEGLSIGACLDK